MVGGPLLDMRLNRRSDLLEEDPPDEDSLEDSSLEELSDDEESLLSRFR
eukprot:IDg18984t1